jgi:hypothetical protein
VFSLCFLAAFSAQKGVQKGGGFCPKKANIPH